MAKRRSDSGQTMVVVALAMPVLLGFLGLGIDMGYMRYMKRHVQMAADAAAIAAANEITSCTAAGCAALTTAAKSAVSTDNSFPSVTQSTGCTPSPSAGATVVVVNNPPSCIATDPHNGNDSYVETIVAENVPTLFSTIFGIKSATITARAEGGLGGGGSCVFALDQAGSGAITNVLSGYTSNCGVVDESGSGSAFNCFFGIFDAPYIGVVGGDGLPFCLFGGASPTTGIKEPNPTDPLAYRQASMEAAAPSPLSCGHSISSPYTGHSGGLLTINTTATLNPGTYCGGISLGPGANVTFNPGIYTLTSTSTSNGGLTIGIGANASGTGVAFYNSDVRSGVATPGNNGGINFVCSSCTAGNVNLTAPTSGPFEGILFFQDPGNTSPSVVVGSTTFNNKLTGTSYFPSASVTFAFDITVDYNDIVAKDITFGVQWNSTTIGTNSYNNYSSLANGSPLKGTTGVLVQ